MANLELKFESDEKHQNEAIDAVSGLFTGHPSSESMGFMTQAIVQPNRLLLDMNTIAANLKSVQANIPGFKPADGLAEPIRETVGTGSGKLKVAFQNFSVEMETGTGKTYVYIRTALELHRRYGFRKFIIVVPSVAIREGVLKTLQITKPHFLNLFDNVSYRFRVYDSAKLNEVRDFTNTDDVQFLVMTLQSFNKAQNVIYASHDKLFGDAAIELIQGVRPILILDEPQNMGSEKSISALAALNPLFCLRYSATHKADQVYNLIYRLTPAEAYNRGLVKKIDVAGVTQENDFNTAFMQVEDFVKSKTLKGIGARLTLDTISRAGKAQRTGKVVHLGYDLAKETNNPEYEGFIVAGIDTDRGTVRFKNGLTLRADQPQGADKEAIFREQIRFTVREHFEKQTKARAQNVKVLSLFFIDRVANYIDNGVIRRLFDAAFDEIKQEYPEWKDRTATEVQAAYFAQQRKRGGEVEYFDTTSGETDKDQVAYDLIMRDKESLLSFVSADDDAETRSRKQVAFIFSHSALREGWDNPNVFQICSLRHVGSERERRQQVGRGVRLPVNQDGERVRDDQLNTLCVVANESYQRYAAGLQDELIAAFGKDGGDIQIRDKFKKIKVRLVEERVGSEEFKQLWRLISRRTRFNVKVDSDELIERVLVGLNEREVPEPRITIGVTRLEMSEDADGLQVTDTGGARGEEVELDVSKRPLPNIVTEIEHLLENTTPEVSLSRASIRQVVAGYKNPRAAMNNPHAFATLASQEIKKQIIRELVAGIKYEPVGGEDEAWFMEQLKSIFDALREEQDDDLLIPSEKSVYDHVKVDKSEIEKTFAKELDKSKATKVFAKLPARFTVKTPVGTYNPDWAIVWQPRDLQEQIKATLFLVRETKSTKNELGTELRGLEEMKIECAKAHFKAIFKGASEPASYDVVTSVEELPTH